jgi:hypothetical protein
MKPGGSGATWTGSPEGVFAGRKHHKPRLALNNITAGVREREDENRTRVAGHRDDVEGVVTKILEFSRYLDGGLIVTSGSLISVPLVAQTVRFQFSSNLRQTPHDIDVRRRER